MEVFQRWGLTISIKSSDAIAELLSAIDQAAFMYDHELTPDNSEAVFSRYCEAIRQAIDISLPKITTLSRKDLRWP